MSEKCSNCLMKNFMDNLDQKFRDDEIRKRAILNKVRNAFNKLVSAVLEKDDPFNRINFLEDLADLHVLLNVNKKFDSRFRYIVKAKLEELQRNQNSESSYETFSCSNCVYFIHKEKPICSLTSREISDLNRVAEWCPLKVENIRKTMEELTKILHLNE